MKHQLDDRDTNDPVSAGCGQQAAEEAEIRSPAVIDLLNYKIKSGRWFKLQNSEGRNSNLHHVVKMKKEKKNNLGWKQSIVTT